jgi:hypothetical protein
MNRNEIKARIRDQIDDHSEAGVFFTDDQLNDLVDEAQEILTAETKNIHRTVFVPLRPSSQFLYLPALAPDIMQVVRVFSQTLNVRLETTSIDNLSSYHQRWPTVTGDPEFWFTVSWDIIGLFPRPTAGGLLRFDYLAWPRALNDDNDSPEIMIASHDVLALIGQYFGELKKWNALSATNAFSKIKGTSTLADGRSNLGKIVHRHFDRGGPFGKSEYNK